MGPNECKYCGCREIRTETDSAIHFRCFSSYWHDGDEWNISNNCAAVCAVQFVELRERVQRAVEVLEGARRICVVISDENDDPLDSEHDGVIYIEAAEADQAAAILRGNSPETPDSSPITADDLAVADYYEAVRQRVPWMVSVEHIEGLVEGYRRCGVSVWQTADEIRKVHGGERGQAE